MSSRPPRRPASLEVGVRRVGELDPAAPLPESDPGLLQRIKEEIGRDGPMTFARFMELALYDPEAGYYTATRDEEAPATGPGRAADFLTAPEGHPLFGWTVARHLESVWAALDRPSRFVVREHGAGTGALAAAILGGLRRAGSPLLETIRYQPIDASPARLAALRDRVDLVGLAERLEPFDPRPEIGAVLANELLDALPVHRVTAAEGGGLLEQYVAVDEAGALSTTLASPSTPGLAAGLLAEGVALAPGQVAEICLALEGWVAAAAASIERGELLLIDYGYPAGRLYEPDRGSTLRAYHRHRVHADPFVAIGRQDLTAHVDLTAVERAADEAGLRPIGATTQALFLAALGAGELLVGLQSDGETDLEGYLAARSALVRMLDPKVTGGFAVMAFGRGLAPGAVLGFH